MWKSPVKIHWSILFWLTAQRAAVGRGGSLSQGPILSLWRGSNTALPQAKSDLPHTAAFRSHTIISYIDSLHTYIDWQTVYYARFTMSPCHRLYSISHTHPLQTLTYETPTELDGWSYDSTVSLKVANETLSCSGIVTSYSDPEFIDFTVLRDGDDVLITVQVMLYSHRHKHGISVYKREKWESISVRLQKKADKLEMTPAELSVWGVQGQELHPCIMKAKETRNKTELFTCEIHNMPVEFWNLKVNLWVKLPNTIYILL